MSSKQLHQYHQNKPQLSTLNPQLSFSFPPKTLTLEPIAIYHLSGFTAGQRSSALPAPAAVEGVRAKMAGLQEKLEAATQEQEALQRRLAIAARQHKADLSDAQLQIQVPAPVGIGG